jgi:uncharacterized protein (DUF2141 family)
MLLSLRWNNVQKGVLKGWWCVLLFAALVSENLPAVAFAQSPCPGIHIKILNIKNSTGTIACAFFESPVGFPIEYLRYAISMMAIEIRDTQARFLSVSG